MKTMLVLVMLLIANVSFAQRDCSFTTKEVNEGTARCEIHADVLRPIFQQECSWGTCYSGQDEYQCESCSDVLVGYATIGEFHYVRNFYAPLPLKTNAKITFNYSVDNILVKDIDKAENVLYGLEDQGDRIAVNQVDISKDIAAVDKTIKDIRYNKTTKDIQLHLEDKIDFSNLKMSLEMRKKEYSYDVYCYKADKVKRCIYKTLDLDKILKSFDYVETAKGEKLLSANYLEIMNEYFPKRRQYTDINDKKVYFELTIKNTLPKIQDPIAPEKYIKERVLKFNGKNVK